MADYTVVNLNSVEDMAPKFGLSPGLESHFARTPLGLKNQGLSLYRIAPGFRIPFGHNHSEQEEVYLVLSGKLRLKLDDDTIELEPFDAIRIPPGAMRAFEGGPAGAELLAVGAPNTDNKDAEMEQGWWSD